MNSPTASVQTEVAGELGADDNKLEVEGLVDGLLSGDPVGVIVLHQG